MPDDITPTGPQGQPSETVTPAPADKAQPTQTVVDDLPEKFKGKSSSDIAKSYLELEKKLTAEGAEKSSYRQQLDNWAAFDKLVTSDPVAFQAVKAVLDKAKSPNRDTTVNDPASTPRDDTRVTVQNMVINQFEAQYGIDKLPEDKRLEMHQKIGRELGELLDPSGSTPTNQLIQKVPSDKLGKFLEKAYKIATIDDASERARLQGLMEAQSNNQAIFSGTQSNGISSNQIKITPEEQRVARKMKMTDEEYIKNKIVE